VLELGIYLTECQGKILMICCDDTLLSRRLQSRFGPRSLFFSGFISFLILKYCRLMLNLFRHLIFKISSASTIWVHSVSALTRTMSDHLLNLQN